VYYTYVLLSQKDRRFYTGWTGNLKKRIEKHNDGEVSSTKYRRPLRLIYYEACLDKYDALRREKYLKTGMSKRYLQNRLKQSLVANSCNGTGLGKEG